MYNKARKSEVATRMKKVSSVGSGSRRAQGEGGMQHGSTGAACRGLDSRRSTGSSWCMCTGGAIKFLSSAAVTIHPPAPPHMLRCANPCRC